MAQKRASDEPDPEAKCGAPSNRILGSLEAYRLVLSNAGQSLAASMLDDGKLDVADRWLQDAAPTAIGSAILALCTDYAQHKEIVDRLLAMMPALWTIFIDDVPFAIRLYLLEAAQQGLLESAFLSIADAAVVEFQHPVTGDTILHYAVENMHVSVVSHFLIQLRCKVIENKAGHHALFAPFIMGSVEAEPMERIIRIFHRARQYNVMLYDPNQVVNDNTILGLLENSPYPNLLRVWMQSYACNGKTSTYQSIYGSRKLSRDVLDTLECFRNKTGHKALCECIVRKDVDRATTLLDKGLQLSRCDSSGHFVSPINIACAQRCREIIPLLFAYGLNQRSGCVCGAQGSIAPLVIAIHMQDFETFQILLDNSPDLRGEFGLVHPVVMMIWQPAFHEKLIQLLPTVDIHRLYSVFHCDSTYRFLCSMLSMCVQTGNADLVKAVIQMDGRAEVDPDDKSLCVAIEQENHPMLMLLLQYTKPKSLESIQLAAHARNQSIFTTIIPSIQSDVEAFRSLAQTTGSLRPCSGCGKKTYIHKPGVMIDEFVKEFSSD